MVETKQKRLQLSCKVEQRELGTFIHELESLEKLERKKSTNQYEKRRYELEKCLIIVYTSGSVVYNPHKNYLELLGKYCKDYDQKIIELQEKALRKNVYDLVIGQDEVGKGELYGPMITASVAIKENDIEAFKLMGVRDSKLVKDREEMKELAFFIEENAVQVAYSTIYCKKLNELITEMKEEERNLEDLLAWQHSNALETMKKELKKKGYTNEHNNDSFLVIIDQFDKIKTDERMKRLLTDNMTVIQHTKAERLSLAVAAASIVAKNKRNERIKKLEEKYRLKLNRRAIRKLKNKPQANEFLKKVFVK